MDGRYPLVSLRIDGLGESLQSAFMARIQEFEPLIKTALTESMGSANLATIVRNQVNKQLEDLVGSILKEPELQETLKSLARKTIIKTLRKDEIGDVA